MYCCLRYDGHEINSDINSDCHSCCCARAQCQVTTYLCHLSLHAHNCCCQFHDVHTLYICHIISICPCTFKASPCGPSALSHSLPACIDGIHQSVGWLLVSSRMAGMALPHQGHVRMLPDPSGNGQVLLHLVTEQQVKLDNSWTLVFNQTGWGYIASQSQPAIWLKDSPSTVIACTPCLMRWSVPHCIKCHSGARPQLV